MKYILYALCFSLASLAPVQAELPIPAKDTPIPQLNFHESWNAEERAALSEYVRTLYLDAPNDIYTYFLSRGLGLTVAEQLEKSLEVLDTYLLPHQELILRIIESGDVSLRVPSMELENRLNWVADDETAALLAMLLGKYEIVKILIERGCDPNHCVQTELGPREHLLSILLSGVCLNSSERTVQKRLELGEWLLEHGADINTPCSGGWGTLGSCLFALVNSYEARYLEWALKHGLKHQYQSIPAMVIRRHPSFLLFSSPQNKILPYVKLLRETGNLPLNDLRFGETPLQQLCSSMSWYYEDREQTLLYLLEQGADPNLIGCSYFEEEEGDRDAKLSPLQHIELFLGFEPSEDEYAAQLERMKTILLQHGAKQL